ncbi:hypothetical protein AVEN_124443-1 [Araneus ventricosus]|uniref:Uncharacterized protein n=1 Tax=Araneus ventricosus TaxID=182803 RepID=A0A4Y2HW43_ARAVE|nr:hypothetical protein AVEN_124443-1 [Araneus ventricosus]
MTRTTPELAPTLQTSAPHQRQDVRPATNDLACNRPNTHRQWNRVLNLETFGPEADTLPLGHRGLPDDGSAHCQAAVPCESPRALSVRLHGAPKVNILLHSESEQWSVQISSDSRGSTVIKKAQNYTKALTRKKDFKSPNFLSHLTFDHFSRFIKPSGSNEQTR